MSRTRQSGALWLALGFLSIVPAGSARANTLTLTPIVLAVDLDDDDDNGLSDSRQFHDIPGDDLAPLRPPQARVTVRVTGPLRLIENGRVIGTEAEINDGREVSVQATGLPNGAAQLHFRAGQSSWNQPVHIVELQFLNHRASPLLGGASHLGFTRRIPNDWSLPRRLDAPSAPHAPEAFRVRVRTPLPSTGELRLLRHSEFASPNQPHRPLTLAVNANDPLSQQTHWLRPISIRSDLFVPGVEGRLVHADLSDRLRVIYDNGRARVHQDIRFGEPSPGPRHPLRARLRIRVLRTHPGGQPVIGRNENHARHIARQQVALANQIWAQCLFDFGNPSEADIAFVDPPTTPMLSVGDEDGLPAEGGGLIQFRAGERTIELNTRRGARPVTTALDIASAVHRAGLEARVFQNPRSELGAFPSADILIASPDGLPVSLTTASTHGVSSDRRQRVDIASVDLGDGLYEFDNHVASGGTMEERALLRTIIDDDPETIDIIVVNRFSRGTRRGEAFIEADGSAFQNVVILDRAGLEASETSWTQAHEIGHVLLDNPYHRDDYGPDRPSLLMDADARDATSHGPRRIPWESCQRARHRSGPSATPTLLHPLQRVSPPSP